MVDSRVSVGFSVPEKSVRDYGRLTRVFRRAGADFGLWNPTGVARRLHQQPDTPPCDQCHVTCYNVHGESHGIKPPRLRMCVATMDPPSSGLRFSLSLSLSLSLFLRSIRADGLTGVSASS